MLAENIDHMVLGRYQAGKSKGKAEGKAEGKGEGKLEGEATMFKAMLASRFGPVPSWVNHQIDGATTAQLLAWGQQLFTATSLEQLFPQP